MTIRVPINLTLVALLLLFISHSLVRVDGHAVLAVVTMAALLAYNWYAFTDNEESN